MVGALIAADNKLLALSGTGELVLAEVRTDAYGELARAQVLAGRCWTPPAYADGRLFVRNAMGRLVALALAVPSPAPTLEISWLGADRLRFSWPAQANGYRLEGLDDLGSAPNWTTVPGSPVVAGDRQIQEAAMGGPRGFYRLQKP